MRIQLIYAVTLFASTTGVSCSRPAVNPYYPVADATPAPAPITLQITNDHPQDVDVFLVDGGTRYRIGMLSTAQTRLFPLPRSTVVTGRQLRLLVHPIGGGGDYLSEEFTVDPGQEVRLGIRASLPQSSFSIRQRWPVSTSEYRRN